MPPGCRPIGEFNGLQLGHRFHLGNLAITQENRRLGIFIGKPGDMEGEQVIEWGLRILRDTPIPHIYIRNFIQEAHGVHRQRSTQPWHLTTIRDDTDACLACLGIKAMLLPDDIGVTTQIAHAGFHLDCHAGNIQVNNNRALHSQKHPRQLAHAPGLLCR